MTEAAQNAATDGAAFSTAETGQQQPDNQQQQSSGWWNTGDAQASSGWWSRQGQDSYSDGWTSRGDWQWQWAPSWTTRSWQQQWGWDSDGWQKPRHQQSQAGRGGDASVPGETREESDAMRRQSMSTCEDDPWLAEGTGSGAGSVDDNTSSKANQTKASGKDFIPEFDGSSPMREYQRRVKLFEISTSIDPSYRAQKLMEKLTGDAWLATESISLDSLKHPDGVARLLDHLWKELEPLEFLRTFQTLADFYKGFRRARGQEFVAYDMQFRRHGQRLEEIGAGLSGVTKAYWFLEKAGLSAELRKQVVAAAGGVYDYYGGRAGYGLISPVIITYRYVFSWSYRRTYKSTYAGLMNSNLRGLSWSVCEDFTRVLLVHSEVYFGYIG